MPSATRSSGFRRGPAERSTHDVAYRAGSAGKSRAKPGGSSAIVQSSTLDLAARLRALYRTRRHRVERPGALLDMIRSVNATLEPARVAEVILDRAAVWVPAPAWALVSSDTSGESTVLAERDLPDDMKPAVLPVASWVQQRGVEFASADLRCDDRISSPAVGTLIAFPLSSRGRVVGVLIALDREASTREPRLPPAMLRAVRVLLEPAATSLDNAILLTRAEALSVTDELTRVHNSRFLKLVLRRETKRAFRNGRPLSLLFLDLDGFKGVNDSHGHLCGSQALVEVAGVLRAAARETDFVARFGGDEFALVLPDTGAEGALAVGERVRQRISAHRFLATDGLDIHLTASVGIATMPDVAASPDELVQAADMAMYRVKQSGKDGIQVARQPTEA